MSTELQISPVWSIGFTRTGRLAHAVRPSDPSAQRDFITHCGLPAMFHSARRWDDRSEDILCCSKCFDGLRKDRSK